MSAIGIHGGPAAAEGDRINAIQALRAVAAGMVVLAHLGYFLKLYGHGGFDGRPLEIGVDIFFVISGYLMVILARRGGAGSQAAGRFLLRRAARLLPLYWLWTSVVLAARVLSGQRPEVHAIVASYLLFPDLLADPAGGAPPLLGVGWTLIYEFYFYLLMAAAIAWRLDHRRGLALVVAILSGVWAANQLTGGSHGLLAHYGDPVVFQFVLGGALALVAPRLKNWPLLRRMAPAGLLAAPVIVLASGQGYVHGSLAWTSAALLTCTGAILLEDVLPWRRLGALIWLGDVSYSIYLGHYYSTALVAVILLPLPAAIETPIYLSAALAIAIAQAALFFRFVECPANRLIRAPDLVLSAKSLAAAYRIRRYRLTEDPR